MYISKKISIVIGLFIVSLLALPIIGNKVIEDDIQNRVASLGQYGIDISKNTKHSSYLSTSRHFEFLLKDTQKFVNYLNKYSDKQMPSYVDVLMDGVVVGTDVSYSNIPFSDDIVVDIYPLKLPKDMVEELQKEDKDFYTYLDKFLKTKGLLYRINYDLITKKFNGYLKDIDESYTFKNQTNIKIVVKDGKFDGKGSLIAPQRVATDIKYMKLKASKGSESLYFDIKGLTTSSNFNAKNTYLTGMSFKDLNLSVKQEMEKSGIYMQGMKFNGSSISLDKTAEMSSKVSLASLRLKSKMIDTQIKDFNSILDISSLDKISFERFSKLLSLSKTDDSFMMKKMLNDALIDLISKGLDIKIVDFSAKHIYLDDLQKDYHGFRMSSDIAILADNSLATKVSLSPLLALQDIDIVTKMVFSKTLYEKLLESNRGLLNLDRFANTINDEVVFDILFSKGSITVNGKSIN